ncbi:hypothetical protein SUGI_0545350 [Cryptomeria japonica]|uniref:cypmaclein-like isoform X1 n=1 Tax=Cryptomeria japonica TaxID=3369 RepID=UPI002408B652|nr:cypmaclein-like isoform X1 [Cryptomeria japonica]GLJ27787.1 hypothetical protein SUGI_0545350 [Cryptomeria japonica]
MPMARFHTRSPIIVFLTVLFIVQVWKVSTHAVEDNVKFVELQTDVGDNSYGGVKAHIDCDKECNRRCSKASLHNRCLKYCRICCEKCNCVPPGTYGYGDVCPCYANLKNSKGGHKCP